MIAGLVHKKELLLGGLKDRIKKRIYAGVVHEIARLRIEAKDEESELYRVGKNRLADQLVTLFSLKVRRGG